MKFSDTISLGLTPKNIKISVLDKEIKLPNEIRSKVNQHWENINRKGIFSRGKVFTIHQIQEDENNLFISLINTDYAHFLYSRKMELSAQYDCTVVYPATLILTSDQHIVYGHMNEGTANPNRIQFVAGGLDENDLEEEHINILNNIDREVYEELGIELTKTKCLSPLSPWLIKRGGKSFVLIYRVTLGLTSQEVKEIHKQYKNKLYSKGDLPEFKRVETIPLNSTELNRLLLSNDPKADYIDPLCIYLLEELKENTIW